MFRRIAHTVALILTLSLMAGSTGASTLQKLSFEQLAKESDIIVAGRVETLKTDDARNKDFAKTQISLSVAEQFKGKASSSIVIEQPGGPVGGVIQGSPGMAEFSAGEQVIVFLRRHSHDTYSLVGGKQGKFTVKVEPNGDRRIVEDFAHRIETHDSFVVRLAEIMKARR